MSADDLAAVRRTLEWISARVGRASGAQVDQALAARACLAERTQATEIGMLPQEITDELARLQDKLQEAERERDNATDRANASDLVREKWQARAKAAEAREAALREALEAWPQDGSVHEPGCLATLDSGGPEDCDCFTSIARAALAEKS